MGGEELIDDFIAMRSPSELRPARTTGSRRKRRPSMLSMFHWVEDGANRDRLMQLKEKLKEQKKHIDELSENM
jgi:hypothetical protein